MATMSICGTSIGSKLGLVDDSRVVPPGGMGMMGGGAPKSKPAAKPKE